MYSIHVLLSAAISSGEVYQDEYAPEELEYQGEQAEYEYEDEQEEY